MKKLQSLIALLLCATMMAVPAFAADEGTAESETAAATEEAAEADAPAAEEAAADADAAAADAATADADTAAAETAPADTDTAAAEAAAIAAAKKAAEEEAARKAAAAEAKALYEKVMANYENVRSMRMNGTMKATVDFGGETMDIDTKMYVDQKIMADGDAQIAMTLWMDTLDMKSEVYYKGGYLYQKMGTEKYKMKMPLDMAQSEMYNYNMELTDDMLEYAYVDTLDDGTRRIVCTIKANTMNDLMDDVMGSMFASMDLGNTSVSFGDITTILYVNDDDELIGQRMKFAASIDVEGETMSTSYNMYYSISKVNQIYAIPFPSDLDSYKAA